MMLAGRQTRGFTLLEMVITITTLLLAFLVTTATYGAASNVAHQAKIHMQVNAENRRGLRVLAGILRESEADSLTGFDPAGVAAALTVERVRGADLTDRMHRPPEVLRWEASGTETATNQILGDVWLIAGSERRILARRVPPNGFRIERSGQTLVVHLTSCSLVHRGEIFQVQGRTAVTVRN